MGGATETEDPVKGLGCSDCGNPKNTLSTNKSCSFPGRVNGRCDLYHQVNETPDAIKHKAEVSRTEERAFKPPLSSYPAHP